jgi:dTDP-4-dehydrorhamnose reductase
MRLLILGKNGQVGHALVVHCERSGIEYHATRRTDLDITNESKVSQFFELDHDYHFAINAAAYTAVDKAEQEAELANAVNHLAIKTLAEQCKKYNLPLIHLSTDYVFDGSKKTNYAECDLVSPLGVYGETKLKGEQILEEIWQKHIILRVSWVFGEHGNNFVKTMVKLSTMKTELGVVSDQYGSPTSASDIARVIVEICQACHAENQGQWWGLYHYSGFPVTTWHQLAVAAISEAKKQEFDVVTDKISAIRTEDYPTPIKRPTNSAFDTTKVQKTFNIQQSAWQDDLVAVIAQLKKEMDT